MRIEVAVNAYEEKLRKYMSEHHVDAEHFSFSRSCHSVAEAAEAAGVSTGDFVKNICLLDSEGRFAVAIVKGEDRVSTSRVAGVLETSSVRLASPEEILIRTGYPCGGTPSFGFEAIVLVDPRVLEKDVVWTGGGSENALVRIASAELLSASKGILARVRK